MKISRDNVIANLYFPRFKTNQKKKLPPLGTRKPFNETNTSSCFHKSLSSLKKTKTEANSTTSCFYTTGMRSTSNALFMTQKPNLKQIESETTMHTKKLNPINLFPFNISINFSSNIIISSIFIFTCL